MILALAGGVGGAKLVDGLAQVLAPSELTIVINTGDDFEHLGFPISPDLDTVMYTLAGIANPETGWGLANETWEFMGALQRLGGETWFRLGDRDLATHVERRRRLSAGDSLSSITARLCESLGVRHRIAPMTDDPVRTMVSTSNGVLPFQEYFVRDRCEPRVDGFTYRGASDAHPGKALRDGLETALLDGVVICPSNPYLSIAPILAIPGVTSALQKCRKVVAVSPIVAAHAIKGPAAKIMKELTADASASGIAKYYEGIIDILVIDRADAGLIPAIESLDIEPVVTDTMMRTPADRIRLARECVALVKRPQVAA